MNKEITYEELVETPIEFATDEPNGCIAGDIFIAVATLVVVIGIIALFKAVASKDGK